MSIYLRFLNMFPCFPVFSHNIKVVISQCHVNAEGKVEATWAIKNIQMLVENASGFIYGLS